MLTGLPQPGQGTHDAVQAILVDETEQEALVIIAEGSNDTIVGRPIEREHAGRGGHVVCVEAASAGSQCDGALRCEVAVMRLRRPLISFTRDSGYQGDAVSGRGVSRSSNWYC